MTIRSIPLCLLLATSAPVLTQEINIPSETIIATQDTFVQRSNPAVNFSNQVLMPIKRISDSHYSEVYFEFDLRPYANRQITQATLSFGVDNHDDNPSNEYGCTVKGVRLLPAMDLSSVTFNDLRLPVQAGSELAPLKTREHELIQTFLISSAGQGECLTGNRATVTPYGQNAAQVSVNLGNKLNAVKGHKIVLSVEEFRPKSAINIYSRESDFPLKPSLALTFSPPNPQIAEIVMAEKNYEQCSADSFIQNPLTGLYQWRGQEFNPNAAQAPDQYERFNWNDLEVGERDYYGIEKHIITKLHNLMPGQKLAFRVRAMEADGNVMPTDLAAIPGAIQTCNENTEANPVWSTNVPNWSHQDVRTRAAELMQSIKREISARGYMDRIAWIDLAFVGRWGEGNSGCTKNMSNSDRQHYVNIYTKTFAFDAMQFVVTTDNEKMLMDALSRNYYPPVGIRRDSLGIEKMRFDELAWQYNSWPLVANRWQTAPVITEFGGGTVNRHRSMWAISPAQVAQWHVSAIGNGNTTSDVPSNPFNPGAPPEIAAHQQAFNQLARNSGARLHLAGIEYQAEIKANQPFPFYTRWLNLGNAPVYEPYAVEIILIDEKGNQHLQQLALNPKDILPTYNRVTGVTRLYQHNDLLTLPYAGSFQAYIRLRDQRTTWPRNPFALCQSTAPDTHIEGAYYLGELSTQSAVKD